MLACYACKLWKTCLKNRKNDVIFSMKRYKKKLISLYRIEWIDQEEKQKQQIDLLLTQTLAREESLINLKK